MDSVISFFDKGLLQNAVVAALVLFIGVWWRMGWRGILSWLGNRKDKFSHKLLGTIISTATTKKIHITWAGLALYLVAFALSTLGSKATSAYVSAVNTSSEAHAILLKAQEVSKDKKDVIILAGKRDAKEKLTDAEAKRWEDLREKYKHDEDALEGATIEGLNELDSYLWITWCISWFLFVLVWYFIIFLIPRWLLTYRLSIWLETYNTRMLAIATKEEGRDLAVRELKVQDLESLKGYLTALLQLATRHNFPMLPEVMLWLQREETVDAANQTNAGQPV